MATVTGDDFANTLTSGTSSDTLNGLGGNDSLSGNGDAPLITASITAMPQVSDNHSLETAVNLSGQFVLGTNPQVTEAQTVPWVSLSTTGIDAFDYCVFNVTQPGTIAIFDSDYGLGFDPMFGLFDAAGNFLDYSADA